jgi:hypothetical protein
MIKESKQSLAAPTLPPMSFARIQVVNGMTTKATPVSWYVFVCSMANALFFPPFHFNHCAASQKKYEACLDIYEGRLVLLRGPFKAGMHDLVVFRGGKEEDKKENCDHNALYFKVRQGD